jgi:hypothetical protein
MAAICLIRNIKLPYLGGKSLIRHVCTLLMSNKYCQNGAHGRSGAVVTTLLLATEKNLCGANTLCLLLTFSICKSKPLYLYVLGLGLNIRV